MSGPGGSWITRLRAGLKRSSTSLTDGLASIFSGRGVDTATVQELEDLLIMADLGPATAARLARAATERKFDGDGAGEAVALALADEIAGILDPLARPLEITAGA